MISRCDASADCVLPGHVTYVAECFATGCWDRAHALGMRMSTVVRPELQLSRAVRVTERAEVRDHVLGGVRPRGGMENHANGLSCGRPVDANKGTRHSISLSSAPQLRTPSSALSVCASAI